MNQEILAQLQPWKRTTFRDQPPELPLQGVVQSIQNGTPSVLLVPNKNKDRWMLYSKETMKPALICFASVWSWGSPFETGNYVPEGKKKPQDLPLSRVQDTPSHLCEISYAFDTSEDRSLYEHIKVLDQLAEKNEAFQSACEGKIQSTFQNGDNPAKSHRYIATAKVFMHKTPYFRMHQIKYPLHPWIKEAVEDKDIRLAPNKGRPRLLDRTSGRWRSVKDTDEDRYGKDDIIWWSFIVVFTIRNQFWSRDLVPVTLVRVGKLDSATRTIYAPMDTDIDFQELGGASGDTDSAPQDGLLDDSTDVGDALEDSGKKRKRQSDTPRPGPGPGAREGDGPHGSVKKQELSRSLTEDGSSDMGNVEQGVSDMDIDDADTMLFSESESEHPPAGLRQQKKRPGRPRR